MTARPWGTTGRVTLVQSYTGDYNDVLVDGVKVGVADRPLGVSPEWRAGAWGHRIARHPSLDAAVMWVLRRADADVWRQERGPVWRVKSGRVPPDCHRCHYHWRIYAPGGSEYTYSGATDTREGWEWALREVFYQLTGAAHRDLS